MQEEETWDFRAHVHFGAVFSRVSRLLGLQFSEEFENRLWAWVDNEFEGEVDSVESLKQGLVSISPTVRCPFSALLNLLLFKILRAYCGWPLDYSTPIGIAISGQEI